VALDLGYRLRAALLENLNLKLVSLIVALALYSVAHGSQDAQRSLLVSVVALTPPETANRELVTPIPPQIRVTLRGPRSTLDDLHADNIGSVQLDLHSGKETRFTFEPSMVPVPPGLKVEQIDPPAIDLTWEDRISRDVPVEVGIVGSPAPGYVVKSAPSAEPGRVRARGPKSQVMVVQHARADAFDVNGLTNGKYTRQLAVDRPPARVIYDVSSVSATIEIGRELAERPFTRVPIAILGRLNAKAQPADVDVRLTCPPEIVRALRSEQIVPRVQLNTPADHGTEALTVQLSIDQCEAHVTPPNVIVRW
jgi:YbbR domain-containing protein